MKTFGNVGVGIQEWNDCVCWVNMFGECGFADAHDAVKYFWELIYAVCQKYVESGELIEVIGWIGKCVDEFTENYERKSEFLGKGGKNLIVTIQNGENKVIGPYTRIGFRLSNN